MSWTDRALRILEYPFSFTEDRASLVRLVRWIEDRKVRAWEIEDRAAFHTSFDATFAKYLHELGCPVAWPSNACIQFLLSRAIECDYDDDDRVEDDAAWDESDTGLVEAVGLDPSHFADKSQAVLALVAAAAARNHASPLRFPLGFTLGDPSLDDKARALRLLYLLDLRQLQDAVNDILIRAQNCIADPKTRLSAGRVGRG